MTTQNQPLNHDLGNGARLVEDVGNSFRVIEPDGRTSVIIQAGAKDANKPFRVRLWRSTQEILDADCKIVAKTTDPEMARHICHLLIAFKNIQDRKASSAS